MSLHMPTYEVITYTYTTHFRSVRRDRCFADGAPARADPADGGCDAGASTRRAVHQLLPCGLGAPFRAEVRCRREIWVRLRTGSRWPTLCKRINGRLTCSLLSVRASSAALEEIGRAHV